jgi:hypothetical protein
VRGLAEAHGRARRHHINRQARLGSRRSCVMTSGIRTGHPFRLSDRSPDSESTARDVPGRCCARKAATVGWFARPGRASRATPHIADGCNIAWPLLVHDPPHDREATRYDTQRWGDCKQPRHGGRTAIARMPFKFAFDQASLGDRPAASSAPHCAMPN